MRPRPPSYDQSAHVGQDAVVHYRRHPLAGHRVRFHGIQQRVDGRFASIEAAPGIVTIVVAWMLDPAACAALTAGPPRPGLDALSALHAWLAERVCRRCSRADLPVASEHPHARPARIDPAAPAPRQLFLSFDAPRLRGLSLAQSRLVLARLAGLMPEATDLPAPEHARDEP